MKPGRHFMDYFAQINPIEWGIGLIQCLYYKDAGYKIAIPRLEFPDMREKHNYHSGHHWSGDDVMALLRQYHVASFRYTMDTDYMYIHVKRKQANWAEYLLHRAGVPFVMSTVNPKNAAWAARHTAMPARWDDQPRDSAGRWGKTKNRRRTKHNREE